MSVQVVNAGGSIGEIFGAIAKEATEALNSILRKGPSADVTKQVEGIVKEARKLDGWGISFVVPDSPYVSPNVPEGYQTVLGYMHEQNPSLLSCAKNARLFWAADETWLQEQAAQRGIPLPRVVASKYLQDAGQTESWAYPLDLLRERLF